MRFKRNDCCLGGSTFPGGLVLVALRHVDSENVSAFGCELICGLRNDVAQCCNQQRVTPTFRVLAHPHSCRAALGREAGPGAACQSAPEAACTIRVRCGDLLPNGP